MADRLQLRLRKRQAPLGLLARQATQATTGRLGLALRRPAKVYGRIGGLEVRLAAGWRDVKRAQRLRYNVFYEEMSAKPGLIAEMRRLDQDPYDAMCDHLLVVDTACADSVNPMAIEPKAKVVGTYRVLRQEVAERGHGFYSEGEYDIAPLLAAKPQLRFLEVGRSCVLKPYRNKRTVELLWHGLWTFVREQKADVLIGCASLPGIDPAAHAMALSFLHHNALAPPEWRCRAHPGRYVPMDILGKHELDTRLALKGMPPLIKAYLRLGAYVGEGAVVDTQFATTDVMIILPVSRIDPRYFEHFGAPDEVKSRVALDA